MSCKVTDRENTDNEIDMTIIAASGLQSCKS